MSKIKQNFLNNISNDYYTNMCTFNNLIEYAKEMRQLLLK